MWQLLSIRKNFYETEEVLVWIKSKEAILPLMDLLGVDAATLRPLPTSEG